MSYTTFRAAYDSSRHLTDGTSRLRSDSHLGLDVEFACIPAAASPQHMHAVTLVQKACPWDACEASVANCTHESSVKSLLSDAGDTQNPQEADVVFEADAVDNTTLVLHGGLHGSALILMDDAMRLIDSNRRIRQQESKDMIERDLADSSRVLRPLQSRTLFSALQAMIHFYESDAHNHPEHGWSAPCGRPPGITRGSQPAAPLAGS